MNTPTYIDDAKRERAERLCSAMESISGVDPIRASRRRLVVTSRMLVAARLLLDGWTEEQVGTFFGKDHSTVNNYRRMFELTMTTPGYEAEREIWEKFTLAI